MLRKRYLRDDDNHPIGLVIMDSEGNFGWSKCHPKDYFNKKMANKIAENRYKYYKENPSNAEYDLENMDSSLAELRDQILYMRESNLQEVWKN